MTTSIDIEKYDLLYGKVLKILGNIERAKQLTSVLYKISSDLGLSNEQLLKYVSQNGLRFDNDVYNQLNNARTNSSQIGFIDQDNIPPAIKQQVV